MSRYLVMPKIGMNMEEALIAEWLVAPGDRVTKDQIILRAETDKSVQDIFATESGTIDRLLADAGDVVPCQANIALLRDDMGEPSPTQPSPVSKPRQPEQPVLSALPSAAAGLTGAIPAIASPKTEGTGRIRISPLARKTAKDLGIDIRMLQPKVEGLRITRDVVTAYQEAAAASSGPAAPESSRVSDPSRVTLVTVVDCEKLWAWRESIKPVFAVGFSELIAKACAAALKRHPGMLARSVPGKMQSAKAIHIGIAVETERGLVMPVLKRVADKSIAELAAEFQSLTGKSRTNTLSPDDISDAAMTVTNLGAYGIESFDPVIQLPAFAALGVGAILETPFVYQHTLCIRKVMKISLAYDCTNLDTAAAAKLMQDIREILEEPLWMLL